MNLRVYVIVAPSGVFSPEGEEHEILVDIASSAGGAEVLLSIHRDIFPEAYIKKMVATSEGAT